MDNNISSDGRQLFPIVLCPKEILQRRKDFFNAHVSIKQNNGSSYINKLEFLLQSAVLKMDDELIGWLGKFAEVIAQKTGRNLTQRHRIFKPNDVWTVKKLESFK